MQQITLSSGYYETNWGVKRVLNMQQFQEKAKKWQEHSHYNDISQADIGKFVEKRCVPLWSCPFKLSSLQESMVTLYLAWLLFFMQATQ